MAANGSGSAASEEAKAMSDSAVFACQAPAHSGTLDRAALSRARPAASGTMRPFAS